jgi:hypothetical protein
MLDEEATRLFEFGGYYVKANQPITIPLANRIITGILAELEVSPRTCRVAFVEEFIVDRNA